MSSSEIITLHRSRGLYGHTLRAALIRHAKVLSACDPDVANELLRRAGKLHRTKESKPGRKPRRPPPPPERLDPERAAWYEHDRRLGLTKGNW